MATSETASQVDESESVVNQQDSATAWLFRGLVAGLLFMGAANALSFFVRSRGWGSLLGNRDTGDEAIGFPLTVWEEANGYGSHALQTTPFLIDIGSAILFGLCIGILAAAKRSTLNPIMDRFRQQSTAAQVRLQFSLRGLLITTILAALAAAAARSFTPRVEVLGAIYVFGPFALIALAFVPRHLSWQQRVAILTPTAIMLIAFAIGLGNVLNVEFDKVMMGIFICWTPQAAIGAIVLSTYLLWREHNQMQCEQSQIAQSP